MILFLCYRLTFLVSLCIKKSSSAIYIFLYVYVQAFCSREKIENILLLPVMKLKCAKTSFSFRSIDNKKFNFINFCPWYEKSSCYKSIKAFPVPFKSYKIINAFRKKKHPTRNGNKHFGNNKKNIILAYIIKRFDKIFPWTDSENFLQEVFFSCTNNLGNCQVPVF